MLSVLILASPHSPPVAIVRTLASLVPLLVQGVLRDVALVAQSTEATRQISDHAGCALAGSVPLAMAQAREPWVLVIAAGFAPEPGFAEEAADVTAGRDAMRLHVRPHSLWTRLFPGLAPLAGLIVPRGTQAECLTGLARQARARKILTTPARRVVQV